jgi:SAM-dependent methyltransferase
MEKSEYYSMYELETSYWWYRVLHELVEFFVKKERKKKELLILDAGCGTGRMMEICSKYGNVTGIDFSTDAVALTKRRGIENVSIGDLNDYPLEKESFDIIICLDVLYHSGIHDDLAVAGKFLHGLKQDGILILNLPAFECLRRSHDEVVHTKKRYKKKSFVRDLENRGFSVLRATYRMPALFFIIIISKLITGKNRKKESESDLKEMPRWMNWLLLKLGKIENWWLKTGLTLPAGSSLFIVATKNKACS